VKEIHSSPANLAEPSGPEEDEWAGLDDPVELLLVVSLAPDTGTLHANLRGPLLINPATRIGCQTVLHDAPYSLRYILTPG